MKTIVLSTIILLHAFIFVSAQSLPGKRDSIYSEVLKENRILQVWLPENYKPGSKEKYDVVYLLDGNDNIKLLSQVQQFAEHENYLPPFIIVGIYNTDRNRDLTPTPAKNFQTAGGAANFLRFLKTELLPYIDKTYPTNGDNILFGHSFGGLFAMYALIQEPQLFSSYLAVDPSFWWDNGYMNKLAAEKLSSLAGLDRTLYISGREGQYQQMGIDGMDSILRTKAPAGFVWKVIGYDNETHNSIKFKSMYDGLKFAYAGYKMKNENIEFHPMNGIVLKDKPFTVYYLNDFPAVRYTSDGTSPTMSSASMQKENILSGPAVLNIKLFTPRGKYDKQTSGHFIKGEALKPIARNSKLKPGGFSYSYYEGKWDSIPNFKELKPVQSGIVDKDFTFHRLPSKINFACLFQGQLEIKEEGYYIFVVDADDGAKFFLGNNLLINYDGEHKSRKTQSYLLPLKKGFYPLRLEYFQKEGGMDLRLKYLVPGSKEPIPIPTEVQYSSN